MKKVCVIPGDDAAPEAVHPVVEVLEGMNLPIEFNKVPGGDEAIQIYGEAPIGLPDEIKKVVDEADCTLFGSVSNKNFSYAVGYYLRFILKCCNHVRPIKYIKGAKSALKNPEDIDWVIVREGLEGLYFGLSIGGELKDLKPVANVLRDRVGEPLNWQLEGVFDLRVITEERTKKIARFGCELALKRKTEGYPGIVTVTDKYNLLDSAKMFRRIVEETVKNEYPDLEFEQYIVDDFARRIVEVPHELDVVIMPNEHGDVLSDSAAATIGGLGIAASGCYGDNYAYFESIAGTYPEAKGLGIINPTAVFLAAVYMLEHLGLCDEGRQLEEAVTGVYEEGTVLTPDQGGKASTNEFCNAVRSKL